MTEQNQTTTTNLSKLHKYTNGFKHLQTNYRKIANNLKHNKHYKQLHDYEHLQKATKIYKQLQHNYNKNQQIQGLRGSNYRKSTREGFWWI